MLMILKQVPAIKYRYGFSGFCIKFSSEFRVSKSRKNFWNDKVYANKSRGFYEC